MLHIVLYQPEIPNNTGSIIRLSANTGATLHLIEPLGFELDDTRLKRAGLDYHEYATLNTWPDVEAFVDTKPYKRLFTLSTHHKTIYTDAKYEDGDALMFGPESRGLPDEVKALAPMTQRLTLPMRANSRSLNLSNSVSVVVYEAWRQLGFDGAV